MTLCKLEEQENFLSCVLEKSQPQNDVVAYGRGFQQGGVFKVRPDTKSRGGAVGFWSNMTGGGAALRS